MKRSREHTCLMADTFQQEATEYYGPGSRCINYNGAAKCHQVQVKFYLTQCSGNVVKIKVGNTVYDCTGGAGSTINVGSGTIQCPDTVDFCTELSRRCPNDCTAHGMCTKSGGCFCNAGWSGQDCSTQSTLDYSKITSSNFTGNGNFIKATVTLILMALAIQF